jgi:serine protease Do
MNIPARSHFSLWLLACACTWLHPLAAEEPLKSLKEREQRVQALVAKVQPAVVCITNKAMAGTGSGIIINKEGLILTAAHVTQATGNELDIIFPDGRHVKGTALGANRGSDAGLAKIDVPGEYPFAEMGDSNLLKLGDWCVALGHPGGFKLDRKPPVRIGRVWQRDPEGGIFTDCTLIGGDSGGPLFDLDGKVIGINASINASAEHNRHVALDTLKGDWDDLMASKVWGELRMSGTDPNRPKLELTFDREKLTGGAAILGVVPNGTADKLGLKEGDVITKFDGTEIPNYFAVMRELSDRKAGDIVKLESKRGDETLTYEIELVPNKRKVAARPPEPKENPDANPNEEPKKPRTMPAEQPVRPRAYCGAELDGTAEQALVTDVAQDSPAAKGGLKAQDIVTALDGKPIRTSLNLAEALRRHKPGDKVSFTIKRGAEVLTLEVTLSKQ